MALPIWIKDGEGKVTEAGVTHDHALKVTMVSSSAVDINTEVLLRYKLFRGFLSNGSITDMAVDGSTASIEYTVEAENDVVRYITGAKLIINGTDFELAGQDLKRFGQATAGGGSLTNGVEFFAEQGGITTLIFDPPVKQTVDFFNWEDGFTNLVNAISAQSDFLSFNFVFDQPVVLAPGLTDRVVVRINDDLTDLDLMTVIVRGYQEVIL